MHYLSVLSCGAIILTWKRESWSLFFNCLPDVLFMLVFCGSVSWVGLQCVIVVFPDHTHILFYNVICHLNIFAKKNVTPSMHVP